MSELAVKRVNDYIESLIANPLTSGWLQGVLITLRYTDPMQAFADVQKLRAVARLRIEAQFPLWSATIEAAH